MTAVRTGTLLATVGLAVAALWAVVYGVAACVGGPGSDPTVGLAGVDVAAGAVIIRSGGTVCPVARPVVGGTAAAMLGVVVGLAGHVGRWHRRRQRANAV